MINQNKELIIRSTKIYKLFTEKIGRIRIYFEEKKHIPFHFIFLIDTLITSYLKDNKSDDKDYRLI